MIVRAAVCPSPPLLARQLTGQAEVFPELRAACAAAVSTLLAAVPDVVVVAGAGPATATWDPDDRLDPSAYAPALGTAGKPGLPLALGLGAMLLDTAGHAGPRVLQAVGEQAPGGECLRLGASLPDLAPRVGLLAMGDGSARRRTAAPGHLDPRAAPFDAAVERALRDGDMAALASLEAGPGRGPAGDRPRGVAGAGRRDERSARARRPGPVRRRTAGRRLPRRRTQAAGSLAG